MSGMLCGARLQQRTAISLRPMPYHSGHPSLILSNDVILRRILQEPYMQIGKAFDRANQVGSRHLSRIEEYDGWVSIHLMHCFYWLDGHMHRALA